MFIHLDDVWMDVFYNGRKMQLTESFTASCWLLDVLDSKHKVGWVVFLIPFAFSINHHLNILLIILLIAR